MWERTINAITTTALLTADKTADKTATAKDKTTARAEKPVTTANKAATTADMNVENLQLLLLLFHSLQLMQKKQVNLFLSNFFD